MNLQELKESLLLLLREDPQFLAELIGDVVKENLIIESQDQCYYDNSTHKPQLRWSYDQHSFSQQ